MGTNPLPDASYPMVVSDGSSAPTVPPTIKAGPSASTPVNALPSSIILPPRLFLDLGLMTGVLFQLKSDLLALYFESMKAIHADLLKSIGAIFHEILNNCVNMIIIDEHVSLNSLISMLLFSMSSATNLVNLED